ncbi:MAG: hypothetical protein Q4D98_13840, partial [Planctomycetia bacterium]|nr:hypothetical protein [Planctomycetia bacterium]
KEGNYPSCPNSQGSLIAPRVAGGGCKFRGVSFASAFRPFVSILVVHGNENPPLRTVQAA